MLLAQKFILESFHRIIVMTTLSTFLGMMYDEVDVTALSKYASIFIEELIDWLHLLLAYIKQPRAEIL